MYVYIYKIDLYMCYRLNDWGVAWRTVETRVGKFYRLAKAIPMVFRGATAIIATAIMNALFVEWCGDITRGAQRGEEEYDQWVRKEVSDRIDR